MQKNIASPGIQDTTWDYKYWDIQFYGQVFLVFVGMSYYLLFIVNQSTTGKLPIVIISSSDLPIFAECVAALMRKECVL
jgi:hypothetical protein